MQRPLSLIFWSYARSVLCETRIAKEGALLIAMCRSGRSHRPLAPGGPAVTRRVQIEASRLGTSDDGGDAAAREIVERQELLAALENAIRERDESRWKLESFLSKASLLLARMLCILAVPMMLISINLQIVLRLHPSTALLAVMVPVSAIFGAVSVIAGITKSGPVVALQWWIRKRIEKAVALLARPMNTEVPRNDPD